MPYDQKRINGPDTSVPYSIYIDLNTKSIKSTVKQKLQNRKDSRKHNELRNLFIKLGVVSQAKGSAYIEMGQTKVICSAFDPREIPNKTNYTTQGELFCEFKFAPFACRKRKGHQQDADEKEYSLIMQRALEPAVCRVAIAYYNISKTLNATKLVLSNNLDFHEFPNFQVDVYALVLDDEGSALGAAIMAASLALANASVPMFGIVTSVTAGIHNDVVLLDPTDREESLCLTSVRNSKRVNHGIIMQAMLSQHEQISEFFLVGSMDIGCVNSCIDILNKTSSEIHPVLQEALTKFIKKMLKGKEEGRS